MKQKPFSVPSVLDDAGVGGTTRDPSTNTLERLEWEWSSRESADRNSGEQRRGT
jgi:hypothetical protein